MGLGFDLSCLSTPTGAGHRERRRAVFPTPKCLQGVQKDTMAIESCWEMKNKNRHTTSILAQLEVIHKHDQHCLCIINWFETQLKWIQKTTFPLLPFEAVPYQQSSLVSGKGDKSCPELSNPVIIVFHHILMLSIQEPTDDLFLWLHLNVENWKGDNACGDSQSLRT